MNARTALLPVLLAAQLVALLSFSVQPVDDAARRSVQALRRPWLELPMHLVTDSGRPLLVAGTVVAVGAGAVGRAVLLETAIVLLPVNLVVEGLKRATFRTRPDGSHRRENAAFPSSHAANAFAVAVVLARRWRRAWPAWFALALAVAFSRLYLDRHWLSDVVAGALMGAGLAIVVLRSWMRWLRSRVPVSPAAA